MSEQTGPSMSTGPGWTVPRSRVPLSTWGALGGRPHNDPSMLLSFERPASPGARVNVPSARDRSAWGRAALQASPRSLKTAQKPHQPPSISGG